MAESVDKFFEMILYFSVVCFPLTTGYMILSLKRLGYDPVGSTVKSKYSIDIDMSFFSKLRKGYELERQNVLVPKLNQISFYTMLIGIMGWPIVEIVRAVP